MTSDIYYTNSYIYVIYNAIRVFLIEKHACMNLCICIDVKFILLTFAG